MAADLIDELCELLTNSLRLARDPHTIDPDAPLFGGELGLDSLDAVELVSVIEKHYQVQIPDSELGRSALATVSSIAELIRKLGARG